MGSATLKSMGVTFATKCDENAGIDVDANQVAYLWKAGAKMAAFAAIMLIAACVVGFAASKVGAAVGRDLREKTFSKVVGFQMPRLTNSLRHHLSREARMIYSRFRWLLL